MYGKFMMKLEALTREQTPPKSIREFANLLDEALNTAQHAPKAQQKKKTKRSRAERDDQSLIKEPIGTAPAKRNHSILAHPSFIAELSSGLRREIQGLSSKDAVSIRQEMDRIERDFIQHLKAQVLKVEAAILPQDEKLLRQMLREVLGEELKAQARAEANEQPDERAGMQQEPLDPVTIPLRSQRHIENALLTDFGYIDKGSEPVPLGPNQQEKLRRRAQAKARQQALATYAKEVLTKRMHHMSERPVVLQMSAHAEGLNEAGDLPQGLCVYSMAPLETEFVSVGADANPTHTAQLVRLGYLPQPYKLGEEGKTPLHWHRQDKLPRDFNLTRYYYEEDTDKPSSWAEEMQTFAAYVLDARAWNPNAGAAEASTAYNFTEDTQYGDPSAALLVRKGQRYEVLKGRELYEALAAFAAKSMLAEKKYGLPMAFVSETLAQVRILAEDVRLSAVSQFVKGNYPHRSVSLIQISCSQNAQYDGVAQKIDFSSPFDVQSFASSPLLSDPLDEEILARMPLDQAQLIRKGSRAYAQTQGKENFQRLDEVLLQPNQKPQPRVR